MGHNVHLPSVAVVFSLLETEHLMVWEVLELSWSRKDQARHCGVLVVTTEVQRRFI